jgi:hypothetical protein
MILKTFLETLRLIPCGWDPDYDTRRHEPKDEHWILIDAWDILREKKLKLAFFTNPLGGPIK